MYSVLASASVGDIPVVLRVPACSDPCAAAVVSRLSEPVYSPRTSTLGGHQRAVRRSPGVRTVPAEADGVCRACGREVAVTRNRGTSLQLADVEVSEEAWV